MDHKFLRLLAGITLVLGALVVPAAPTLAVHWCGPLGVSMDPLEGYVGDDIPIAITLKNNINQQLEVSAIDVDFFWDATIWDWGAMSLAPSQSRSETGFILLPTDAADYRVDITVHGQAPVQDFFEETCDFSGTFTVLALPPPPSLIVTANPTGGWSPIQVNFAATVNDGLAPFTYAWTFGDGASGSGASVSHVYTFPGTFTAQVVVTDSRGRSSAETVTVTVTGTGVNIAGMGDLLTLILVIVVLVAVVIAVLTVVLLRRRRRPREGPWVPPPPSGSDQEPRPPDHQEGEEGGSPEGPSETGPGRST